MSVARWMGELMSNRDSSSQEPRRPNARFRRVDDIRELAALQEEEDAAEAGFTIADRYLVLSTLGQGGMGTVYKTQDTRLDRIVAIKMIHPQLITYQQASNRFFREARALARLNHPNILTLYDYGQANDQHFLVMEVGGRDLERVMESHEGPLPIDQVLELALGVARALDYAHAHGIIHRDLKPANVLVETDGDASGPPPLAGLESVKVMDFGLAKIAGTGTLTVPSTAVGTPQYMSPEQALGQDTNERCDLYSLGVFIYELATGVRPFDSDDAQAVLMQHLNLQPVAPTVFNPDIPPPLEALILHLLEKDPNRRPSSAREVMAVLEGVSSGSQEVAPRSDGVAAPTPVRQLPSLMTLIGRREELDALKARYEAVAGGGGGRLVMVAGDAGTGKTRFVEEFATYARLRGARALWGRSYDDRGVPSYWPWVQVIGAYVHAESVEQARAALGAGASDIAAIVPEVRERLPDIAPSNAGDNPEQARFRLFSAVANMVRSMSLQQPLVLIIDDLHDADRPTLLLLEHVARTVAQERVLIVGLYRDVELSRQHPLAQTLGELAGEPFFERVTLRGLVREEVGRFITAAIGRPASGWLVDQIFEQTDGNPFFVTEIVRMLLEDDADRISRLDDEDAAESRGRTIRIPESVREILGRRLDKLSRECNDLLTIAAVAGREFSFQLVSALSDGDEDSVLETLEEALDARIIQETRTPWEYRFTHTLLHETLVDELSTIRRARLHGRIGEALEARYGRDADAHAAELAPHFVHSATPSRNFAEKAARYSRLAGERAEAATAWEEAAEHYEMCLTVMGDAEDGLGQDEAAILTSLGRSYKHAAEPRAMWRNLMRAIDLFRERGDGIGLARATVEAATLVGAPRQRLLPTVEEALAAVRGADAYLEGLLEGWRAGTAALSDETRNAAASRAGEIAQASGFSDLEAELMLLEASRAAQLGQDDQALDGLRKALDIASDGGHYQIAGRAWMAIVYENMRRGDVDAGAVAATDALTHMRKYHIRLLEQNCLVALAAAALLRCDYQRFDGLAREMRGENLWIAAAKAGRAEVAGDAEKAVALAEMANAPGWVGQTLEGQLWGTIARTRYNAGNIDGAREALHSWLLAFRDGSLLSFAVTAVDECLPALGDDDLVEDVYAEVSQWPTQRLDDIATRSLDRIRGALALRIGRVDEAETWLQAGLEWAERERCPVEKGRCLQGLAEVADQRGNAADAVDPLQRAVALFERHDAALYLRQARQRLEAPQA